MLHNPIRSAGSILCNTLVILQQTVDNDTETTENVRGRVHINSSQIETNVVCVRKTEVITIENVLEELRGKRKLNIRSSNKTTSSGEVDCGM